MSKPNPPKLSKSRLAAFKQCPKRLWLEHHKTVRVEYSAAAKARFMAGNQVGEVARKLLPDGVLIGHQDDLGRALDETELWQLVTPDQSVFEGTFEREGVLVRVDALVPVGGRGAPRYRLCEVKSSAAVKEYHYFDIAVQKWVLEGQAKPLRIKQSELAVIDNTFVYGGRQDYRGLFKSHIVDLAIRQELEAIPVLVQAARKTLQAKMPKIEMGAQCTDPFECPFIEHCCKSAPPQPKYPVTLLPNVKVLAQQLMDEGYSDLRKVPASRMESVRSELLRRVHAVTVSGKPYLSPEAARTLAELPYPRYYLDFETVAFAVPIWEDTRPYESLPFQWSCHIETAPGKFIHKECLSDDDLYPVWWVIDQLRNTLGTKGPIFVYSGYENTTLQAVARRHPDLAPSIKAILERLFDLLPLTRAHYYHPKMLGKWGMKNVLPAIAPDLDYSKLGEVQDGAAASTAFMELIADQTSEKRRRSLRRDLLEYCERDTWAMVRLVRVLEGQSPRSARIGTQGSKRNTHPDGRPRRKRAPAPMRDSIMELLAPTPRARRGRQ